MKVSAPRLENPSEQPEANNLGRGCSLKRARSSVCLAHLGPLCTPACEATTTPYRLDHPERPPATTWTTEVRFLVTILKQSIPHMLLHLTRFRLHKEKSPCSGTGRVQQE